MSAPLVVVGDALLDRDLDGRVERLAPDAPVPVVDEVRERRRPGGAALAAALAAADGRDVVLVSALASDGAGAELAEELARAGVTVIDLGLHGETPEKVRIRGGERSLLRLDRGGREPGPIGPLHDAAREAIAGAAGVLVADYGRGVAAAADVRGALQALGPAVPLVWDPHPRGPAPVPGVLVVTPNRGEAAALVPGVAGESLGSQGQRARALLHRWGAVNVCVTLGAQGALLVSGEALPIAVPAAPAPDGGDPCGAGDRFASLLAGLLADGRLPSEAVGAAVVGASAFVATGGAGAVELGPGGALEPAVPEPGAEPPTAEQVIALTRASGGTVVATGGCFDLLHAGHVRMLQDARALGDCLIVLLNSDDSVRRLKGPERPLVGERDRAAVLAGLGCVDAVEIFDEDTPGPVLERLRPDLFAKGGDYAVSDLPETPVLESFGAQAVIVPYVQGRSTTRLIAEARSRGGL